MPKKIDAEIEAIKTLLDTLTPLSQEARQSVVDYVLKRLQLVPAKASAFTATSPLVERIQASLEAARPEPTMPVHIRAFKEEKKPKSAIEMAALVAYYLSHLAPETERKDAITRKDIETYFKIAGYRLPSKP